MIFKRLRIHNVASIEDAEIDFQNGPLCQEPLFLITGPTGSGKTTILDAICLALYGETPRMEKGESNVKVIDRFFSNKKKADSVMEEKEIAINHKGQLLRRGTAEGWTELEFEADDGNSYRAKWMVWRSYGRPDGNLNNPKNAIENLATHEVTEKGFKEKVKEIVRLSFDEFCRTTMLAQGEFTKFIQSSSKEKSAILERLTGTTHFSEISKKIFTIKTEKKNDYERLAAVAESIVLLTDEQLKVKKQQKASCEQQASAIEREIKTLGIRHEWLSKRQQLIQSISQYEENIVEMEKRTSAASYQEEKRLVADFNATVQPRGWLEEVRKAEERKKLLEAKTDEMTSWFATLLRYRLMLTQQQDNALADIAAITEQRLNQKHLEPMLLEAKTIVERLRSVINDEQLEIRKKINRKEAEAIIPKEEENKAKCETKEQRLRDALAEIDTKLAQHENKRKQMRPQELQERYDSLNTTIGDLDKANGALQLLENCRKQWGDAEDVYKSLFDEREKYESQALSLKEECQRRQRNYDDAKEIYDKWQRSLDDSFRMVRASLKEGEKCPLCLQIVTANHVPDPDYETYLKPVIQRRDEADNELKEAKAKETANQKLLHDVMGKLPVAKEKWDRLKLAFDEQYGKTEMLIAKTGVSVGLLDSDGQKRDALMARREIVVRAQDEVKAQLAVLNELNATIDKIRKEKDLLNESCRKAHDDTIAVVARIKSARQEVVALDGQITELQTKIKERLEALDSQIAYDNWRETWQADHEGFIRQLQTDAKNLDDLLKKQQTLTQLVETRKMVLDSLRHSYDNILSRMPDWQRIEPMTGVLEKQDAVSIQERWTSFSNQLTAWRTEMKSNAEAIDEKSRQIEGFLNEHDDISHQRLSELAEMSADIIQQQADRHRELENLLLQQKGAYENLRKQMREHEEKKPEMASDDTIDSLSSAIGEKNEEKGRLLMTIGQLRNEMEEDARRRTQSEETMKECERCREEMVKWNAFCNEFGSADGTRFSLIAQSFILAYLLNHANTYLTKFTDRYELVCEPGSLAILVRDRFSNQSPQFVKVLSGGESFMVSLSMALALSQLNVNQANIDTLFIDEGFGSLDEDCLNSVMDTLEKLHQMGGRKVGVISHVEALNDRIHTQIQVSRIDPTRSQVIVTKI